MKSYIIAILLIIASFACAQQAATPEQALQADRAEGLYGRAKNLYDSGQASSNLEQRIEYITKAGEIFAEFLNEFPRDANVKSAEYYYALCFYHTGRIDDAKRIFSSIINTQRNGPYVAAASSSLAHDAFEKKEYATAAVLFQKLSANAPRPADRLRGLYYEALCYHYQNKEKDALAAYQKIVNDPDSANSVYLNDSRKAVGALLLKMNQPKDALPYFEALIKSAASEKMRAEASLYAGITTLQMEDEPAAERYFQSILSNKSEDWRFYHDDALTSMMQIRFNKKNYTEVIQIHKSNPINSGDERQARRSNIAARSYMLLGNFMDAIPLFLDVQKLLPDDEIAFDASYNRLLCFYKIDGKHIVEQVDAFIDIYGKSRKTHPRIHAALMMKAGALQNEGKLKEAAEVYNLIDASLIAESNRANFLYQRGWCLANSDDHQGAIRSLTKFIDDYASDKRTPEAIALRGDSHLESGDRDSALKDFNKLIEIKPGPKLEAYAWQKSAIVKKQNNDLPGMVTCYKTMLERYKDLPSDTVANAEFFIGYGLQKQSNNKDAVPHLQKARELDEKTYGKRAGLLLISCHFLMEQIDPLAEEIDKAIDSGYSDKISPALVSWAGIQALGMKKAEQASRFFMLISNPEEPRRTPRDVWRNLAKALILSKEYQRALAPIDNVLAVEDNTMAKADALVDQARCHLALKDLTKARASIEACFLLRPQGALEAEASIVFGDICMAQDKPAEAKEKYSFIVISIEDARLRPLATYKIIKALEANHETALAEKYRNELVTKFPTWKFEE